MTAHSRLIRDRSSFTSSTELLPLSSNLYIDELTMHWKVDNDSATAVSVASALDLVNPIEVRLNGSAVISIRGSDLLALNAYLLNHYPFTVVAGSATDQQTKIMGMRVPLWQPPRGPGELDIRVVRSAVTNADSETITICEKSNDQQLKPNYLHYVERPMTLSSSTGYGNKDDLPSPGNLIGILFYNSTIPTVSAETASVQAIKMRIDGDLEHEREFHELKAEASTHDLLSSPASAAILDNYIFWDFRDDPIAPGNNIEIDINAGVASDSIRIIPIYIV